VGVEEKKWDQKKLIPESTFLSKKLILIFCPKFLTLGSNIFAIQNFKIPPTIDLGIHFFALQNFKSPTKI